MKYCPKCRSTYTDETLAFCTQDGTPLVAFSPSAESFNEPETIVSSNVQPNNQMRINIQEPQKEVQTPFDNFQTAEKTSNKSGILWVVLGTIFGMLVVFGLGGLAVWFYLTNGTGGKNEIVEKTNANSTPTNSTNNNPANLTANNNVSNQTPSPTPKPTLKPAEIAKTKQDIENVIYSWKEAAESIDLDANVNNYAETVDYYNKKLSLSKVKANKQKAYETYDTISVKIRNMKIVPEPNGEKATVTFDKEWNFESLDKFNRGEVQQQLILTKINGKWKISGEKDLKVYYTDKGKNNDEGNEDSEGF